MSWRHRDHTRGSLPLSLLVLALPLLATSFGQGVLFQLVDLSFISRLGEEATTAVIVTNQSLRQLFFMLVVGASFGAQGMIARAIGAGSVERAEHVAGQLVLLGAALSAAVALLGALVPGPLLAAMNVSPGVLEVGIPYVRLTFLLNFGFVFAFLFNSILSGAGDTTTPLAISLVQTAVSLFAEWTLIFGHLGLPALGVSGVALGVATGQGVALLLALVVLFRGTSRVHLRGRHLAPDLSVIKDIAKLSWPPAVQMLGGFLVTVLFLRMVGGFGPQAQAGYSIGLRLALVGPMVAMPLAGAAGTLVAQNLGSGDVPRAWRALGVGLAVNVALLWSTALAVLVFRTSIVSFFSDDPEVIRIGSEFLLYQSGVLACFGFYFIFFRSLMSAGDVLAPMSISLATGLCLTLPLGIWLSSRLGPSGLFAASLTGTAVLTLLTGLWVISGHWTRARAGERAAAPLPAAEPQ